MPMLADYNGFGSAQHGVRVFVTFTDPAFDQKAAIQKLNAHFAERKSRPLGFLIGEFRSADAFLSGNCIMTVAEIFTQHWTDAARRRLRRRMVAALGTDVAFRITSEAITRA